MIYKIKDKIKENIQKFRLAILYIVKLKNKIVYKIMKKIYILMYRRVTYIPEKGMWVSTVVFPGNIVDGICGMTDVFAGDRKKVESFEALHSEYIKKGSESGDIHRNVVKLVKTGIVTKNIY